jgi:hypothetical protein
MIFFKILLLLPGTILHELLHFIVGLIFNGKPVGFSLLPKKTPHGYILGSVSFRNITFYNATPIALAPVLGVIPIFYLINLLQNESQLQMQILYGYLIWTFFKCILPSTQDINVMFSYLSGIIFYGILGYVGYTIL